MVHKVLETVYIHAHNVYMRTMYTRAQCIQEHRYTTLARKCIRSRSMCTHLGKKMQKSENGCKILRQMINEKWIKTLP